MDIKGLEYFVTIANHKNMRKAAEILYVSQPTLSYFITKLEKELGTPLFSREKGRLELTEAGQLYYNAAVKVIQIRQNLYHDISTLNNANHLTVGAFSLWGNQVISAVMPQVYQAFPHLIFETSQLHFFQPVLAQSSDLDFYLSSFESETSLSEDMELLWEEELYFTVPISSIFSLERIGKSTVTPEEIFACIRQSALVISKQGTANFHLVRRFYKEHGEPFPDNICDVNGLALTTGVLESGVGVGFIPASGCHLSRNLRYFSVEPKLMRYNALWHRPDLENYPAQMLFHDLVLQYFRNAKIPGTAGYMDPPFELGQ